MSERIKLPTAADGDLIRDAVGRIIAVCGARNEVAKQIVSALNQSALTKTERAVVQAALSVGWAPAAMQSRQCLFVAVAKLREKLEAERAKKGKR